MSTNESIFELYDYIDENSLEEGSALKEHLVYVDKEWEKLPDDKLKDGDRTLLALPMIDLTLKSKEFALAKKWIDIYLYDENDRDHIALYEGKLEFEKGNFKQAYSLFEEAFKLSSGRMMEGKGVYQDFYLHPEKYYEREG